jgi:sugar phosphate isomerase/epimerase
LTDGSVCPTMMQRGFLCGGAGAFACQPGHRTRRHFLGAAAGALAAAYGIADPMGVPIGLHLAGTRGDLRKTLHEIAAIGYREIEIAGLREMRASDLRRLLDEAGLVCKSAHWTLWEDESHIEATIDAATELGVEYLVTPLPSLMGREWFEANETEAGRRAVLEKMTVNDWRWNADWFNHVGGLAQKTNLQFVYHNHSFEFRKRGAGIEFDELLQRTDASRVRLEFDCGGAASAGYDPVAFLKKYGDRVVMLHVSEVEASVPIGRGRIDWQAVFVAAKAAGVRRYFVETPWELARPGYEYLHGLRE